MYVIGDLEFVQTMTGVTSLHEKTIHVEMR